MKRPHEIVFAKFTDKTFEVRTHYIHLTDISSDLWQDLIYFRDYLNSHKAARKEYEKIKLEFVNEKNEGIEEYTDLKENFVKKVLANKQTHE